MNIGRIVDGVTMKKILFLSSIIFPTVACAQSVYMHEAQEDSLHSEPISFGGIMVLLLIVGFIYLVVKAIQLNEDSKIKKELKQLDDRLAAKEKGGFVCPACGTIVLDDNFIVINQTYENHCYDVKYCYRCGTNYKNYIKDCHSYRKQSDENVMPKWFFILSLIVVVGITLFAFIRNCIIGDVLNAILSLIIVPAVICGFFIGPLLMLVNYALKKPEPKKPFEKPTLSHIRNCNALVSNEKAV